MGEASARPTLGTLVDYLSPIVRIVAAPEGTDVSVGPPVIADPSELPVTHAGDVVLAVGVDVARPGDLLREAAAAGAAAVAFKVRDDVPPAVVDAALAAGVAVLAVSPDVAWGQLFSLFLAAASAGGEYLETWAGDIPTGDLFALANAVAGVVDAAVTIEDRHANVVAYSSEHEAADEARRATILGRKAPEEWVARLRGDGVYRRLWSGDVVRVEYDDADFRPRLAVGVIAGSEPLGVIWLMQGDEPFDGRAELVLREAARIAAVHLIRHSVGEGLERQRRGKALRAALDGELSPERFADALRLPAGPMAVLAFELDDDEDSGLALHAERAVDIASFYCQAYRRPAAAVAVGDLVYLLVVCAGSAPPDLVRLAADIVERVQHSVRVPVRAGVSSVVATAGELTTARWEADQALRMRTETPAAVADIEQVRSDATLDRLLELASEDPRVGLGRVAALVDHDRRARTQYVDTLAAYFDAGGDVPAAARSLGIHRNTFHYRLRRLCDASGLDLDDPVDRLVAELQVRMVRRHGTAGAADAAPERSSGLDEVDD